MSTIAIDDRTKAALEANATARGLSLPDYLTLVAQTDLASAARDDHARQNELRRRMKECISAATTEAPQPNRPLGMSGEFADAMFSKYRG